MTITDNARIRRETDAVFQDGWMVEEATWRVEFHDDAASQAVAEIVGEWYMHEHGRDGEVVVETDEARMIRESLAMNGLVVICDSSLMYGKAEA
jgi:hypothetical protein